MVLGASAREVGIAAGTPSTVATGVHPTPYTVSNVSNDGGIVGAQLTESVSAGDETGFGSATGVAVASGFNTPNAQSGVGVNGIGIVTGATFGTGLGRGSILNWSSAAGGDAFYSLTSQEIAGVELPPDTMVTVFGALYVFASLDMAGYIPGDPDFGNSVVNVAVSLGGHDVTINASINIDSVDPSTATYIRDGQTVFQVPIGNSFSYATTFLWEAPLSAVLAVDHARGAIVQGGGQQFFGRSFGMYYLQTNIVSWSLPD